MELLRTLSRNRTAVGYCLIVVSTVCFSVNNNLAKESYAYGVSVDIMLVGRSWTLTLLLGCWFAFRGVRPTVPRGLVPLVLFCIVMFSLNAWSLLTAFDLMPVSLAILIFYLFPFLVSLLAAVLGIERLKPVMVIGLLVAFGGLILTLDSSGDLNIAGVVLSLVAALAIAGNILTSGRLLRSGMSSVALSFWVMVGASVVFTLSLLVTGIDVGPISTTGWFVFIAAVLFAGAAFTTFYMALGFLSEARTALVMNLEPVLTIIIAVFLFAEPFGAYQWLGAGLVFAAIIGVTLASRRT